MNAVIRSASYSLLIRNGILERCKLVPPFDACAAYGRSRARPIQAENIPYLGVYLVEESMAPDGDGNHAEPRFTHRLVIGFSYIIQNNDPEAAEDRLDAGHWSIMKLLHDPDWHRFEYADEPVLLEAVIAGTRTHHFGNIGNNTNETPVAEVRTELTYTYRSMFQPIISDSFERLHTKVIYPYPEDPAVVPIVTEWVLDQ